MAQHTPGPWRTSPNNPTTIYGKRGEGAVAKVLERYMNRAERLANAALMTAAPDLLEVVEELAQYGGLDHLSFDLLNKAKAAVAKAKGQNPA